MTSASDDKSCVSKFNQVENDIQNYINAQLIILQDSAYDAGYEAGQAAALRSPAPAATVTYATWAGALMATRTGKFHIEAECVSVVIAAQDEGKANVTATNMCHERWPDSDGWINHSQSVVAIPRLTQPAPTDAPHDTRKWSNITPRYSVGKSEDDSVLILDHDKHHVIAHSTEHELNNVIEMLNRANGWLPTETPALTDAMRALVKACQPFLKHSMWPYPNEVDALSSAIYAVAAVRGAGGEGE